MKVLICGDRHYANYTRIYDFVKTLPKGTIVIEGGALGADTLAHRAAQACGLQIETYKADWNRYKRAAGPIRNQQMLDEGKPDVVVAFHDNLATSKGTKNMLRQAFNAGVEVMLNPIEWKTV